MKIIIKVFQNKGFWLVEVKEEISVRYSDTHTYKIHAMREARELKKSYPEAVIEVYDRNGEYHKSE